MKRDTCAACHKGWTDEESEYQIESIQNYIRGKINKTEFWLAQLIDAYVVAKRAGVSEDVLKEARAAQDKAQSLWEWWTAENSDGFHNPEAARESLARSMDLTQGAVKKLNEATRREARHRCPGSGCRQLQRLPRNRQARSLCRAGESRLFF